MINSRGLPCHFLPCDVPLNGQALWKPLSSVWFWIVLCMGRGLDAGQTSGVGPNVRSAVMDSPLEGNCGALAYSSPPLPHWVVRRFALLGTPSCKCTALPQVPQQCGQAVMGWNLQHWETNPAFINWLSQAFVTVMAHWLTPRGFRNSHFSWLHK